MPLHPKARLFVQQIAEQGRPPWQEIPVDESRRLFASMKMTFGDGPDMASVEDHSFDGVPVRVFRPNKNTQVPVVMYFHGGGFVIGDLDTHDSLCRRLASASDCAVVAVHYRRAPEHPFPAAMDDCFAATSYISHRANELDLDETKIIVAGDSAGGNLATTVAIRARDEGGPALAGQVLIYPVIAPGYETESYRSFATGHGLTLETMKWFWDQYLGQVDLSSINQSYLFPSQGQLAGLPQAHVIVAEYDVLRDEGLDYAEQLKQAGVATTTMQYDGMLHGFVHFAGFFEVGMQAAADIGTVIRTMVGAE